MSAKAAAPKNAGLRSYVMAKLLWDVKADANKLIDEFLDGCYGKAAKPMRAYFDLMQGQVRKDVVLRRLFGTFRKILGVP